MVDGLELLDEHRLGILNVAEGDGTLAEVAVGDHRVDDAVHQRADGLLGVVGQRARGRLHGVGHHQDGLLLGEGVGARVGEEQLVDLFVGVLVLVFHEEELGLALSVVGGDELADDGGQVVLVGQFQTFGDVADNHLRTLDAVETLVRIDAARLVLGEVDGVLNLAYVVVEGARAHQLALGANLACYLGRQVAHLDRVLEGARCHLAHAAQHLFVHVGKLNERDVRREAEGLLDDVEQGVAAEEQQAVDDEAGELGAVEVGHVVAAHPFERHVDQYARDGDEHGRPEQLRAAAQFAQREDGRNAHERLYGHKLQRPLEHGRHNEYEHGMGKEGRARVHEHADEDGHHRKRQDEHVHQAVADEQCGQQREDDDEGVEHGRGARLLEIVVAEEAQVEREGRDEEQHVEDLAHERDAQLRLALVTALYLRLERYQHVVGAAADHLAAVDDFLAALNHALGQRDAAQQVGLAGFAALVVELDVGGNVVVQVALLQRLFIGCEQGVAEQFLVGLHGGEHVAGTHADGLLAVDDAYDAHRVDLLVGCAKVPFVDNALRVDAVQLVGNDAHKLAAQFGYAALEVLHEAAHLFGFHRLHVVVVGLVVLHQTVALGLHGVFALVDGEVEGCHKVAVAPYLVFLKLEVAAMVAWHEPNDDGHRAYDEYDAQQPVAQRHL